VRPIILPFVCVELLIINSASLDDQERKDAKSQNTNGNPIRLQGKILAVYLDPLNKGSIYVAQSNGSVRRIILAVSELCSFAVMILILL
jgi:hypothetical protein